MGRRLVLLISLFTFAASSLLQAEGTKQILLADGGHGKVQVMSSFSNFAWYTSGGTSAPADYRLHIRIKNAGEIIYYGFGDLLDNSDMPFSIPVNYRIKNPSGTIVVGPAPVPTSGTGYISTFAEAVAGPSAIVGATGYAALSYTSLVAGDYFIEFNFNDGGFNPDRCKFKYFDITVASAANGAIDGRVWSKAWQFTADNNGVNYDFHGKLFIYTADSIVTSVNCNGMAPYVFTIACNQWGCYNTGNFAVDRKSVSGKHILPQYKIFLNNPDPLIYPTGILGQIIPPVTTTPNCNGTAVISMTVNKAGNAEVYLDINPAPGMQIQDVKLSNAVTVGLNQFNWNGLNGLGQPVPNGTVFNIKVVYINGLTNLPIYDIDQNPNGFIIDLHRPTGPIPGVFWDDSEVGGGQNLITGCIYDLPTSTGCHAVPLSIGNDNTINTWWNAVVDTSTAPILFTEQRAPQPLGAIHGVPSLCPGTNNVMYYVTSDPNTETYQWVYSGTGATINGNLNDTVYIDFSGVATSGTLTVTGYNAACGAGNNPSSMAINLLPFPNVTFGAFGPVCIDDPPFPLSGGAPVGGTYTIGGNPIVIFDPAAYGAGTFTVTYTYSDPMTGCTKSIPQSLTVSNLPAVTMAPLGNVCTNLPPFLLTQGSPAGGIYSGPGVAGGSFDPSVAGAGIHTIVYTYSDPVTTCTNSANTSITVSAATQAVLTPFAPVCENILPFPLSNGTPSGAGGVYTGTGVSGGVFDPAAAGVGIHDITYTYTNAEGCITSDMKPISVLPVPGTPGLITGPASLCQGTATSNFSTTAIADAGTYSWSLVPPGAGTVAGNSSAVTVTWAPLFTGVVDVTVTGVNGCGNGPVSIPHQTMVYPAAVATFVTCTDSVTLRTASPIILKGGFPLGGTYTGPGVDAGGIFHPNVSGPGLFTLTYTYTNNFGCIATATKQIRVLNPVAFTCGNPYRDIRDNKNYATVLIGGRCWMAVNLDYGRSIVAAGHQRDNCVVEKYCYNDNPANCTNQGGLYQWDEVMAYSSATSVQGLCPPAWHIPTETEWTTLFSNFIGNGFAASPLKYTGFSGFNAFLSGAAHVNQDMSWNGFATMFWTSDAHGSKKAWAHGMNRPDASVSSYPSFRNNAFFIRCIKD